MCLVLSRINYCNAIYCGLPASALHRLQLKRLPIQLKTGALMFKLLNSLASPYLTDTPAKVSSLPDRSQLHSSSSASLVTPRVRCPILGGRTFASYGTKLWNGLPPHVTSANSLPHFKCLSFVSSRKVCCD